MSHDEILASFNQIARDVLDKPNLVLVRETEAAQVDGWDSLAHISLIVAAEREFHLKFTLDELQDVKNVGQLTDLISHKLG